MSSTDLEYRNTFGCIAVMLSYKTHKRNKKYEVNNHRRCTQLLISINTKVHFFFLIVKFIFHARHKKTQTDGDPAKFHLKTIIIRWNCIH